MSIFAQNTSSDSGKVVTLKEVQIAANKTPQTLFNNPGAVSVVNIYQLSLMPKTTGAEEALRLVPGIRIDNQHGGERVHLSIRGQGILTERGLRGIGVIIDGIPLNDPSGFAPDLYDVDWATIKRIEVLRGPAAGLYGGSSAGGVINITTQEGGSKPLEGKLSQTFGTDHFRKSLLQLSGNKGGTNYRVSFSRTDGDAYRDHQAFWSNKLYEKITFTPSAKFSITQILSHTDYFQQNPEGLNLAQFDNLWQANPDANPFNEYQKTNRNTLGFHTKYLISERHDLEASAYVRNWNYKETSNKAAEYRTITNPGATLQYNLHLNKGTLKNTFSLGTDIKYQNIVMYKLMSGQDPNRTESIDEYNIELDTLLANQIISQKSAGFYALYNLNFGKLNFTGNIRYDNLSNELTNKMMGADSATTTKNFTNTSFRLSASYNIMKSLTAFANFSQGFIPPSTEELSSNPVGYSGFNTYLVPATSNCFEFGIRGFGGKKVYYELTAFNMTTKNDFFRFKQSGRGNQEVFYGNAGNSQRKGLEAFFTWEILKNLTLQTSYTYADYKYTSSSINPIYTDTSYVLTTPPAEGQVLPNSPKHQLYTEAVYSLNKNIKISFGIEHQSEWAIYTDANAYNEELDPEIYQNWQDGFTLLNAKLSYEWKFNGLNGECSLSARNISNETYMAFTEPDPDGNSYQPGPGRQLYGNITIKF